MKYHQHCFIQKVLIFVFYAASTLVSITGLSLIFVFAIASPFNTVNTKTNIESIQVIGKKHQGINQQLASSEIIALDEQLNFSQTITEIINQVPGVDINGQGGLFQVYSIQGLSGARVQTQISGITLHSERRAGTSASFISPFLLNKVEVLKGASSTLYGSGAIGGIVQLSPRHFETIEFSSSLNIANNKTAQNIAWGNDNYSIALSKQSANNSKTTSGDTLNSHFHQTSATLIGNWQLSDHIQAKFLLLPSYGKDIGKVNNDDFINKKYTNYPEEKHLISQLALITNDWQANIAAHTQQLTTNVERFNKRKNTIDTESTDYNLNLATQWQFDNFSGQFGSDLQLRNNVKAIENQQSLVNNELLTGTNLFAQQFDSAVFSHLTIAMEKMSISSGIRFNHIKQKNKEVHSNNRFSDHEWTGFAKAFFPLTQNAQLSASISKGFRMASLSERFYSGSTARGETLGNLYLLPEKSTYYSATLSASQFKMTVYSNQIENYIERINLDENTRTYQNVLNGIIKGAEFSYHQQVNDQLAYRLYGDYIVGKTEHNDNLSGIPANKIQLILNYHENSWSAQLKLKHRFKKNNIARHEQTLGSTNIVSLHWLYEINNQWQFSLWADNLLNESYTLTTDKRSTLSSRRQIGLKIHWFGF